MNQISDPLAAQKTAAANIGLGNYQTASNAVPSLSNYYSQNFGQTPQQTLGNEDPLSQEAYAQVQQGMTGNGGPFASLTKNLLGSFDAGNAQNVQNQNQQLQAQGLGGSGAGAAVQANQGVQAAMQRALLGSQEGVAQLQMAQQLGQNLMAQNQQQGFNNPMAALGQIQSLASPPNFQDVNNTYYTPQSNFQTTADILGAASPLLGSMMGQAIGGGGGQAQPGGNGAPALGATGTPPANYYSGVNSMMNNPQLLQMLMASGGG